MAVQEEILNEVKEKFEPLEGLVFKKMFGGIGIFRDGLMFSMISSKNKLYFRVNHDDTAKFEALGSASFNPHKRGKGMPYWEVPDSVYSDRNEFIQWAEEAYQIALDSNA